MKLTAAARRDADSGAKAAPVLAPGATLDPADTDVIAGVVAWWLTREEQRGDQLALGLVLGGALGNIVDRARLGYVFDFLDLHIGEFRPFLVFNVADACISIGVVILILRAFLVREPKLSKEPDNA